MKRFKKVALALLSSAMIASPLLTSCSNDEPSKSDSGQVVASVKSIAITTQPNKVEYESGDIFDPTGMVVTATLSNGQTQVVTNYTYSKAPLTASDTQVKITYKGKSAYVKIKVTFVVKCTSIKVEDLPTKTNYVVGEKFDPTGMKVVGMYNDGTKKVITDYDWDKKEALKTTDTMVTITYEKLKTTLMIKVTEATVSGVEITTKPTKLAYLIGEKFDATGMVVSSVSNNGEKTALESKDYSIDKTDALTAEDNVITITYKEKFHASLKISVSEKKLTGIEIQGTLNKSEYWEGETLSLNGVKVVAKYEGAEDRILKAEEYDVDKNVLTKEDTKVTISFGGFSKEIAITVKEKVTSVTVDGLKTVRIEAEHLDTSKAALREDFIAAGRGFIENGVGASNGQNICGYNPGSIFEIPVNSDKECEIFITAIMSDTNLNYKINDGVEFKMDETVMKAEDVKFEYNGGNDYWNWKRVIIGKVTLPAGKHMFTIRSINQRPNLDCFDFKVNKYGDQVAEKKLTKLNVKTAPTKLTYTAGETFDPTGMVIEGEYDDFTTATITDYTIDKTGPLTADDDAITISYKGLSVTVKIQVGKAYTAKINGLGEKKVEAEDFDFKDCIHRSDMPAGYVVSNEKASGGKSIERYTEKSKFTLDILVGETASVKFSIFAADTTGNHFDDMVTVKLDDKVIKSNNPALASAPGNQYYNWQEALFDLGELTKGDHAITIEMTNARPNMDYVSFFTTKYGSQTMEHNLDSIEIATNPTKMDYIVGETFDPTGMVIMAHYSDKVNEAVTDYTIDKTAPLTINDTTVTISFGGKSVTLTIKIKEAVDFTVTDEGTILKEAEDADWSTLIGDRNGVGAESNSFSSGGKSIGHISGGYLEYKFNMTQEMNLTVTMVLAKYEAVKVSSLISSITIDGNEATYDDITLGRTDGNDWFNMKDCNITCGKLAAGVHSFRVNFKGGPNLDCFKFVFSK